MDLFKKFKEKKKKKKNTERGQFKKIIVGGNVQKASNFYLYKAKNEDCVYVEIAAAEELPDLHYSEVEMEVILSTKKLTVKAEYNDAYTKGKFKVYKFIVLDLHEYYI